MFNRLFATKSLEQLNKEMAADEGRLRRVLGPVGLTSLGIGAIIGAGIFVMTGRVAANETGPAIILSYVVAGVGCTLAALCYAEFASMAPVAGSAYTYAYATLGELLAWIIGWDLILEYAMSAATVGAVWTKYFNELTKVLFDWTVPDRFCHDPFSEPGAYLNLPAVFILAIVTVVLVIGIRESAASNTILVLVKLGVVLFVIAMGAQYVSKANWFDVPSEGRKLPQQLLVGSIAEKVGNAENDLIVASRSWTGAQSHDTDDAERDMLVAQRIAVTIDKGNPLNLTIPPDAKELEKKDKARRVIRLREQALGVYMRKRALEIRDTLVSQNRATPEEADIRKARADAELNKHLDAMAKEHEIDLTINEVDQKKIDRILLIADKKAPAEKTRKWGLLGAIGLDKLLGGIDDKTRSNFMPYGISGIMLGAALVFFAFIGFDSISTHSEEAIRPQRDVPIGILASLFICTLLYIAVSSVISGMKEYPTIDTDAAVASAFRERGEAAEAAGQPSRLLKASAGLIAAGGLAGMTSVLLITFLSQARVFLAMARDGLMPYSIFGTVHPKFKTPHISTIITGVIICVVAAFTPILVLEEMVNIGTLFAFVVVCCAVLILRFKRPEARRPFRAPLIYFVAPAGILVNVTMMLFLPPETWMRLVVWLGIGLVIYFCYGYWNSALAKRKASGTEG